MNRWQRVGCAALALTLVNGAVQAQQERPTKALAITAVNVTAEQQRRYEADDPAREAAPAYPGDVIEYRLVFTNITEVPVRNIEFKDAIPAGLIYQRSSSTSDAADVIVDFSIDGGTSYHAEPSVERLINGVRTREPAPVERYTHIRWRVRDWVQPGAQVSVEFRVALPDDADRNNASSSRGREG